MRSNFTAPEVKELLGLSDWICDFGDYLPANNSCPFLYGINDVNDLPTASRHAVDTFYPDRNKLSLMVKYLSCGCCGFRCAIFSHDKCVYVVFRGAHEPHDWRFDLERESKIELKSGIAVHSGFNKDLNSHLLEINSAVDQLLAVGAKEVRITGHGLGGALCTLFAYKTAVRFLELENAPKISAISFASPRVGNEGFRLAFDAVFPAFMNTQNRFLRVANNRDIATAVPMYNYKHVGNFVLHLTDAGPQLYVGYEYSVFTFSLWWNDQEQDHQARKYWDRLHLGEWP